MTSFPTMAMLLLLPLASVETASIGDYELMGSCTFQNQWTGETCLEFRGISWTVETMGSRCETEAEGIWSAQGCPVSDALAGWCAVGDDQSGMAATAMMITPASDCAFNTMACETFLQGTFEAAAGCSDSGGEEKEPKPPPTAAAAAPGTISGCYRGGRCNGRHGCCDCDSTEEECDVSQGFIWTSDGGCAEICWTDGPAPSEDMSAPMQEMSPVDEEMPSSGSTKPFCDESLSSPVKLECPAEPEMVVSYGGSSIDCAEALSVEDAAVVPTVRVDNVEEDALYSLLLVDTSNSPVHPILHFGAVNVPGSLLKQGLSLDSSDITIFSNYRGPNPPKPDEMWSTPEVQQTLFVYEYMLSPQPGGSIASETVMDSTTMTFDYEAFFEETVGIPAFDESSILSTYFRSGRCNFDFGPTDIVIEDFANPQFLWESIMTESMANAGDGGDDNWGFDGSLTWDFSGYNKTEFEEINDYEQETFEMDNGWRDGYYESIEGSSVEIADGIFVLKANIKDFETGMMGGMMMGSGNAPNQIATNARGVFPDLRSCEGLRFVAQQSCSDCGGWILDYNGFKVDIGYTKLEGSVFGYGYRASLALQPEDAGDVSLARAWAVVIEDEDGYITVDIPFEDFTLDWDWNTGEVVTTCQEDAQYCVDEATLKNMETLTITALGSTRGVTQELRIKSIAGTGCDASAAASSNGSNSNGGATKEDQWTCSSSSGNPSDEILLESFSNPSFGWAAQNDPVMGGESTSSVTMMEDGAAYFTGEVKDVPFLGVPGFIQMEARGGEYPDASCCTALKLNVMGMEEYAGYRISFGTRRAKTGFFASGFKADFDAPINEFGDVIIPFDMFSVEWDEATGDQIVTCAEDPTVCPDLETLRNMETMAIWGEGVGGELNLYVRSISAVGCSGGSAPSGSSNMPTMEEVEADTVEEMEADTMEEIEAVMGDGFVRQDVIDAWKARNSGESSSPSSSTAISFLLVASVMVAVSELFL